MKKVTIALVPGDGAGPEMMEVACEVTKEAAKRDGVDLIYERTPMGWGCLEEFGDTLPPTSLERAAEIGTVFFGGVGDYILEKTLTPQQLKFAPEARCLLALRKAMGLLLNFRPMVFLKELVDVAKVLPEMIPDEGVTVAIVRFLLQDGYFGNQDLWDLFTEEQRNELGMKRSVGDVTGEEDIIVDLAYYRRETIEKYMRAAFAYARAANLPLTSVHKSNVMPRYKLWQIVSQKIAREFPDVPFSEVLVDTACARIVKPAFLRGVVAGGNEHMDIISDGLAEAVGSMGLMYSSSINPDNDAAMFESGAGTACDIKGQGAANCIGRILAGAMMNRHIGATRAADFTELAVRRVLSDGWRTRDIFKNGKDDSGKLLGTQAMGDKILKFMDQIK